MKGKVFIVIIDIGIAVSVYFFIQGVLEEWEFDSAISGAAIVFGLFARNWVPLFQKKDSNILKGGNHIAPVIVGLIGISIFSLFSLSNGKANDAYNTAYNNENNIVRIESKVEYLEGYSHYHNY